MSIEFVFSSTCVFFLIIIIIIFVSLMSPFVFSRCLWVGHSIRRKVIFDDTFFFYRCRCFFSVRLVSRHGDEAYRIRGNGRGDDAGCDDDSLALVQFQLHVIRCARSFSPYMLSLIIHLINYFTIFVPFFFSSTSSSIVVITFFFVLIRFYVRQNCHTVYEILS